MNIISPLSKTGKTELYQEIDIGYLVESYRKRLDIDITKYFVGIDKIQIYTCLTTFYRFYYPFNLGGDGEFYSRLQNISWYYMPWKWEHQKACEYLKKEMRVLEVGCAKGDFLDQIKERVALVKGLELNKEAIKLSKNKGFDISEETIQEHTARKESYYDFVCSFQVLEHISDVYSFLEAQIKVLKKGGLLWISVPNNDAFPKLDWENDILNMPPHHMGLWNEKSLRNLEKIFPVSLREVAFEPLQEYHYQWYQNIVEKTKTRNRLQALIYYHLGGRERLASNIRKNAMSIKGHTIAAVYEKI